MENADISPLNRSFSDPDLYFNCSKPQYRRKIVIKEYVEYPNGSPLIRQFSCEEIYDTKSKYVNCDQTSALHNPKEPRALEYKVQATPMDIDEMDVGSRNNKQLNIEEKFQKARKLQVTFDNKQKSSQETSNNVKTRKSAFFRLGSSTVIGFISIIYLLYMKESYKGTHVNVEELDDVLHKEIVAQNHAIEVVVRNLAQLDQLPDGTIRVLPFIGGTGVGKTHLVNLLKRHYGNNIQEVNKMQLSNFVVKENLFSNFHKHTTNLLVIDNIFVSNMPTIIDFIRSLPTDYKILVISVCNTNKIDENLNQEYDQDLVDTLTKMLSSSEFHLEIVTFDNVTVDDMKTWLLGELLKLNVQEDRRRAIIDKVIVEHDVERGFKGLHAKLMLEIERETDISRDGRFEPKF